MNLQGLTCIGEFNGVDVFWSSKSDNSYYELNEKVIKGEINFSVLSVSEMESRNKFLEKQQSPYRFWKETTGLQNVVLYNSNLLYVHSGVLCSYDVDHVELPINCSSCNFMFSHLNVKSSRMFCNRFDTSFVVSALGMFTGCTFISGLSFGKSFDTKRIVDARFMFGGAYFGSNVNLGKLFTLDSAKNTSYMFAYSVFEQGINLPGALSLKNVNTHTNMFKCCSFLSSSIDVDCSDESIIYQLQTRGT